MKFNIEYYKLIREMVLTQGTGNKREVLSDLELR